MVERVQFVSAAGERAEGQRRIRADLALQLNVKLLHHFEGLHDMNINLDLNCLFLFVDHFDGLSQERWGPTYSDQNGHNQMPQT